MPDKGQRATDAEFRRLRAKVNDIYRQAYKEIEQKGKEFAQAFARREAQMRQQVADGKMTQADFDAWLRGQVFQGKQWAAKKKQIEDTLYHADQVAQSLVNDARFNVFAANANYVTQDIGKVTRVDTSFNLYDANAVKRLAVKQPDLLPPKKKVGKDKSYKWYNRQVNTAITQGIIQGASIGEIARRIGKQTGESNCTAMLRNARTMFTGAQNAGRIDGLHQAQELGIRVQKQWMATPDNRTRDTHAELDGQIVDVDEPFITSAGNEIMYPGDPAADPSEVWNCRCTLVYVYPEYSNSMEPMDNETGENVGDMTYREWEEMKRGEEVEPEEEQNAPIAKVIEYGDLFPDDVGQITRDTLDDLNREYPISRELDYVGDVRTHRGLDPDVDIFDLHNEYPNLNSCGAQYLARGADGKSGPCIEIHKESYSTQKLQDEFDERYALRLKYGDPMQPPKPGDAFYTVSDTFEGTIRHEYGHALSDDKGVFGGGQDNSFRKWQKEYWETHRAELPAISQYAASHPDEMFAEAFVQAQDTRHPDTLAYKLSREIMDAFERYMRGEPL